MARRALWIAVGLVIGLTVYASAAQAQQDDSAEALLIEAAKRAVAAKNYRRAGTLIDRALRINPRRLDAYVLRASVHAMLTDYTNSVAVMRRAYRLAPNNLDVLTALGSQLMLAGKRGEAVALLERVIARASTRYDAQVVLGHYYIKRKRWRRAIRALHAYFSTRPAALAQQDATHRAALARAYLRSGNARRALRLYRRLLRKDSTSVAGRLGQAWASAAISCRRALPLLRGLQDLTQRYPSVLMVHGRCALLRKKPGLALTLAQRYLKQRATDAQGWALLGQARRITGDIVGARQAFTTALGRGVKNRRWSFQLAQLERMSGSPRQAAIRLRAAGPRPGQVDEWTMELGESLYASGQFVELRRLLAPWVATQPTRAQAQALLGLALVSLKHHALAVPHLRAAMRLNSTQSRVRGPLVRALVSQAVAAFGKRDYATAEALLLRARAVDATWLVLRNLGAVLTKAGKPGAAVGMLTASLAKRNDRVTAFLLGRAYRLAKQFKRALKTLQRAAALTGRTPSSTAIVLEIAASRLDAGQYREAVAVLAKAERGATGVDKLQLESAHYAAARQAASRWLSAGLFLPAYRLLLGVVQRLPRGSGVKRVGALCDLALAATGAGYRDNALRRLRGLGNVTCPYPAPMDHLAVPILLAWNQGRNVVLANRSLKRLRLLGRRAGDIAQPLVTAASADVALRAAAVAFSKGQRRRARLFLDTAARLAPKSREIAHNQAVLLLAAGKRARAISRLKVVAPWVPMAHINLGIAYELEGKPRLALEQFRRAHKAKVGFGQLAKWIATKRRVWGIQ